MHADARHMLLAAVLEYCCSVHTDLVDNAVRTYIFHGRCSNFARLPDWAMPPGATWAIRNAAQTYVRAIR
jgi:hypothetical protein